MMGTLTSVWSRLKPPLESAMKTPLPAGSKADPKKTAHAIQQFLTQFPPLMAQLEAIYKKKAEVDASFKQTADNALKLLQPLLQQLDAAHKDGFNPNASAQDNLDGRLSEMIDRLKELKQYGSQVQWD